MTTEVFGDASATGSAALPGRSPRRDQRSSQWRTTSPEPRVVPASRFDSLDGIRGLGMAAVLVFHAGVGIPGAFLAVSTFFTLSGFLITSLLLSEHERHGRIDLRRFWSRRFRRLLPAALICIGLSSVLVWTAARSTWSSSFRADGLWTLAYAANWRLIASGQAYESAFSSPSPVQHFWSLAIEEQVYLLIPLILVAVLVWLSRSRRVLAVVLTGLFVGSALVPLVFGLEGDRVYFGTDTRLAEVVAGALLAVVLREARGSRSKASIPVPDRGKLPVIGAVATVAMLVTWLLSSRTATWVSSGGLAIYAVLSALVVLAALVPDTGMARVLSFRPIAALGVISYGVYLYHWPIYLWLLPRTRTWSPLVQLAVGASVTILLAALSYHFIEQPIRLGRVRYRPRHAAEHRPVSWSRFGVLAPSLTIAVALLVILATVSVPASTGLDLAKAEGSLTETLHAAGTEPLDVAAPSQVPAAPGATVTPQLPSATDAGSSPTSLVAAPPQKPLRLPNRPLRLLVVGDSSMVMMLRAMAPWGDRNKAWVLSNSARIGCGIGRGGGRLNGDRAEPIPENCEDFSREWPKALQKVKPDVVLVADAMWDLTDRQLSRDGPWLRLGMPEYDSYLRSELSAATDLLGSTGAAVLWLDNATLGYGRELVPPRMDFAVNDKDRTDRFNKLLREIASTRPFVRVLPFAQFMESRSGGPFELRPDGLHVNDATAIVTLEWLGPEMLDQYWSVQDARGTKRR